MDDQNGNKIIFSNPNEPVRTSECCSECEHETNRWCDDPCFRCGKVNNYFHFIPKENTL